MIADKILIQDTKIAIQNAEAILVFAGAGMSVDSGLPTYRDKEGFWNDYPLYRGIKKNYAAMVSPHGFSKSPNFTWGFFANQYKLYKNAEPHAGYTELLRILNEKEEYFVTTTNVDGMFLKAGIPKNHLHEAHGSIHKLQCTRLCHREAWNIQTLAIEIDYSTMNALDPLPLCPSCGEVSRPNIFMFGDTDESYIWEASQNSAKRFRDWRKKNIHKKVVIFEIGVGAEGLKKHVKQYYKEFSDVTLIRINPELDNSYGDTVHQVNKGAKDGILALSKNI